MKLHAKTAWKESAWTFSTAHPLAFMHLLFSCLSKCPFFLPLIQWLISIPMLMSFKVLSLLSSYPYSEWSHLPMFSTTWNLSPAPTNQPAVPTAASYRCPPATQTSSPSPAYFSKFPFTVNGSIVHPITKLGLYSRLFPLINSSI